MTPSGRALAVIGNYRKTEVILPKIVKVGMAERYEGDILLTEREGGVWSIEALPVTPSPTTEDPDAPTAEPV